MILFSICIHFMLEPCLEIWFEVGIKINFFPKWAASFYFFTYLFFFFLTVLEFELRALHLLGEDSTVLPPALLALVIFQIRSHIFAQGHPGPPSSYLCLLYSWNDRCVPPGLFVEMRSHLLFCSVWPLTMILLISASQVAGITRVYHYAWSNFCKVITQVKCLGTMILILGVLFVFLSLGSPL
jgi:hypothetical protein